MDFVGAVGESQGALTGVHAGEWGPLRDTGGAVHLNRLINDLADALGDHRLDGRDPDAGLGVAERVHCLGGAQHHHPHRFDLGAGPGDDFHIAAEADQRLAEALAGGATSHHQVKRLFRRTDRAHAVVNAARAEAQLADLETSPFAEEHVVGRDAHVIETDVHVAVRGIVLAEDVHGAEDFHARRIDRDEDL